MSEPRTLKVAILGCGTVGLEVARILLRWRDEQALAEEFVPVITGIAARDWSRAERAMIPPALRVGTAAELFERGADVYVELAGGLDAAGEFVRGALQRGKPVVTANKALLAEHGAELFQLAAKHGAGIEHEAAVGGGIPLVVALKEGLIANSLNRIVGILNGTCNYILTRMAEDKLSYSNALKMAQDKGYAEADPSADVSGFDAAQKLVVLTHIAFGIWARLDQVDRRGIEQVRNEDVLLARNLGYQLKSVAVCHRQASGVSLFVGPVLVPEQSVLAGVRLNGNAVQYHANLAGTVTLMGEGAGGAPTASAVVSDIARIGMGRLTPGGKRPGPRIQVTPAKWKKQYFLRWPVKATFDSAKLCAELDELRLPVRQQAARSHQNQQHLGVLVEGDAERAPLARLGERHGIGAPAMVPLLETEPPRR